MADTVAAINSDEILLTVDLNRKFPVTPADKCISQVFTISWTDKESVKVFFPTPDNYVPGSAKDTSKKSKSQPLKACSDNISIDTAADTSFESSQATYIMINENDAKLFFRKIFKNLEIWYAKGVDDSVIIRSRPRQENDIVAGAGLVYRPQWQVLASLTELKEKCSPAGSPVESKPASPANNIYLINHNGDTLLNDTSGILKPENATTTKQSKTEVIAAGYKSIEMDIDQSAEISGPQVVKPETDAGKPSDAGPQTKDKEEQITKKVKLDLCLKFASDQFEIRFGSNHPQLSKSRRSPIKLNLNQKKWLVFAIYSAIKACPFIVYKCTAPSFAINDYVKNWVYDNIDVLRTVNQELDRKENEKWQLDNLTCDIKNHNDWIADCNIDLNYQYSRIRLNEITDGEWLLPVNIVSSKGINLLTNVRVKIQWTNGNASPPQK